MNDSYFKIHVEVYPFQSLNHLYSKTTLKQSLGQLCSTSVNRFHQHTVLRRSNVSLSYITRISPVSTTYSANVKTGRQNLVLANF